MKSLLSVGQIKDDKLVFYFGFVELVKMTKDQYKEFAGKILILGKIDGNEAIEAAKQSNSNLIPINEIL